MGFCKTAWCLEWQSTIDNSSRNTSLYILKTPSQQADILKNQQPKRPVLKEDRLPFFTSVELCVCVCVCITDLKIYVTQFHYP